MSYLFTIVLLGYTAFLVYLILCVISQKRNIVSQSQGKTPVSIIIPFRDEENNLERLLQSLKKLQYNGPIELLLINDGSTDASVQLIQNSRIGFPFPVTIIDSHFDSTINLTSKQQALDLGIRSAKYDHCVFTDADMTFNSNWLTRLTEHTADTNAPSLIVGHTSIFPHDTQFAYFQAFQLEFLFAAAYAFHSSGITGSCMGNNICLLKSAYCRAGGFQKIGYSIVEDRALFATITKQKGRIAFTSPFTPAAFTQPAFTLKQFTHQTLRWATGGITYTSNLILPAILLLIQNFTLIYSLIHFSTYPGIIALINFIVTWVFVALIFKKINSPINPLYFPVYFTLMIIETLIVGFFIIFRPGIVWKGRRI